MSLTPAVRGKLPGPGPAGTQERSLQPGEARWGLCLSAPPSCTRVGLTNTTIFLGVLRCGRVRQGRG